MYPSLLLERLGLEKSWKTQDPFLYTIENYSPGKVIDFCSSVAMLYARLRYNYNPQIAIFPLRGAMPIAKSLEAYIENDPQPPDLYPIYSPIGLTHQDGTGKPCHPSFEQKKEVLERDLNFMIGDLERQRDNAMKRGDEFSIPQSVVLIDEVQTGQSISETARILDQIVPQDWSLNVLAYENVTTKWKKKGKTLEYQALSNNTGYIRVDKVTGKFFSIDVPQVLPIIVKPGGDSVSSSFLMSHVLHNTEADSMIKNLTRAVLLPDAFTRIVQDPMIDLSRADFNQREARSAGNMQSWMNDALERQISNHDRESLANWLRIYAGHLIRRGSGRS